MHQTDFLLLLALLWGAAKLAAERMGQLVPLVSLQVTRSNLGAG